MGYLSVLHLPLKSKEDIGSGFVKSKFKLCSIEWSIYKATL